MQKVQNSIINRFPFDSSQGNSEEKRGYLTKQGAVFSVFRTFLFSNYCVGGFVKSWKVRWFVLRDSVLYYYKNEKVLFHVSIAQFSVTPATGFRTCRKH